MEAKSLTVEYRSERGKNASRKLRRNGFIPGILYSHGESEVIQIPQKEFYKLFKGRILESVIFDIHTGTKNDEAEKMAYVKDYHVDPLTGELMHVDLFKVTKGEKIHTHVQIEFVGTAKGTKLGGILEVDLRELEVECLPMDLPEKIQIDVANLEIGDSIHVKDVILGDQIRITTNPEASIASVHVPKVAVIEEKVEEAVAVEGEGEEAKAAVEGEEKAEKDKDKDKDKEKGKEK
ncbi:MAG: 50S ribosomal protein L25 [Spirochaetes bacterium]|nr:50S ribosomal protein L25 [Spirochaetota bacterium]